MARTFALFSAIISQGLALHAQPDVPVSFAQPNFGAREALVRHRVLSAQREGFLSRLGEAAGGVGAWWANGGALSKLFGFQGTHRVDAVSEDFANESTGESSHESFTQDDYEEAVGSNSMQEFATRVADAEGLEVVRTDAFSVFLKWYDGTCQKQSYDALVAAMHLCVVDGAMCGNSIVAKGSNLWEQSVVLLSQLTKKALSKHPRSGVSESRPSANRSKVVKITSRFNSTSRKRSVKAGAALRSKSAGVGATAPLNEDGYAMVADADNSEQMCLFTRRVISAEGLVLTDEGALVSFCSWYSGELARQSYEALVAELHVSADRPEECGGSWLTNDES